MRERVPGFENLLQVGGTFAGLMYTLYLDFHLTCLHVWIAFSRIFVRIQNGFGHCLLPSYTGEGAEKEMKIEMKIVLIDASFRNYAQGKTSWMF